MQANSSLLDANRSCVSRFPSRGLRLCLQASSTKNSQTECTLCQQSTQRRQLLLASLILPAVELCPWPASAKVAGMHCLTAVRLPGCHQQVNFAVCRRKAQTPAVSDQGAFHDM